MNTEIPHLKIERLENGCIRLENIHCGESYIVDVHPIHLRYMAEQMGFVSEVSPTDADMVRMVAKLKRRMLVLQKRIEHLASFLCIHSDSQHADLTYEQDYATATADICEEFCADLDVPDVSRGTDAGHPSKVESDSTLGKGAPGAPLCTEHRPPVPTLPDQLELGA